MAFGDSSLPSRTGAPAEVSTGRGRRGAAVIVLPALVVAAVLLAACGSSRARATDSDDEGSDAGRECPDASCDAGRGARTSGCPAGTTSVAGKSGGVCIADNDCTTGSTCRQLSCVPAGAVLCGSAALSWVCPSNTSSCARSATGGYECCVGAGSDGGGGGAASYCKPYAQHVIDVARSAGCAGAGKDAATLEAECNRYVTDHVVPNGCEREYRAYLECTLSATTCNPCRPEYCATNACLCKATRNDPKLCVPNCF